MHALFLILSIFLACTSNTAVEENTDDSKKEEEDKFKAFAGSGRRLDNKGSSKTSSLPESSSSKTSSVASNTPSKSSFQRGGARANKFSKKKSLVAFDGKANKF
jgi:hypothetical protein